MAEMEVGERHARLVAVRFVQRLQAGAKVWLFRCDCGNTLEAWAKAVRAGNTKSCGCLAREGTKLRFTTHGHAAGRKRSAEHRVWLHLKDRCHNPRADDFDRYGGRGIEVCKRWRDSFEAFLADMGPRPSLEHTIDRKDNDGNYEPGNCRWTDRKTQARNKRSNRVVTYAGRQVSLAEACEAAGLPYGRVARRLQLGWSVERALESSPCL